MSLDQQCFVVNLERCGIDRPSDCFSANDGFMAGLRRHSLGSPNSPADPQKLAVRRGQTVHTIKIESDASLEIPTPVQSPSSKSSWSELLRLKKKPGSASSIRSNSSSTLSLSGVSSAMSERLKELRKKFTSRTEYFKEKTTQPLTPTDNEEEEEVKNKNEDDKDGDAEKEEHFFFPGPPEKAEEVVVKYVGCGKCRFKAPKFLSKFKLPKIIEPQSPWYVMWLFIVALAFIYNAWVIPLRGCFGLHENPTSPMYETTPAWLCFDYLSDLIYILDIVLVKCRISFINNGIVETRFEETKKHYFRKIDFKLDVASLLPLDILYLAVGYQPFLRAARVLKIKTFWEFFDRFDQAAKSGHIIRVLKTCTYMVYLIHIESCGYYLVSFLQGFGTTTWVFRNDPDKPVTPYIRCFYIATKTATSIGKNPIPTNNLEYIFMTVYWLSGVFVFASLIGQIRDIFEAAGAVKSNYRKTMDITIWYMQSLNLPKNLQNRVRTWFNYNWDQQKTLNENSLIDTLPRKMRTDLAIHVHFQTLSKVKLFQDCDKNLLYDMILKLKPVLYLPGDFICKKGEVGTEMYIVMNGSVEVVGGPNNDTVFATLHTGSVFGEISLLALSGGNRRTADVRSKGFSNLFLLSKADFDEAMNDYPEAAALLKKRSKKLLNQNKKIEEKKRSIPEPVEVIKREPTPKLVKTVIKVIKPDSGVGRMLGKKSKSNKVNPEQALPVKRKLARSITDELKDNVSPPSSPEVTEQPIATEDDNLSILSSSDEQPTNTNIAQNGDEAEPDVISQMSDEDISLSGEPALNLDDNDESLESLLQDVERELNQRRCTPAPGQGIKLVDETGDRSPSVEHVHSRPISKQSKDTLNAELAELGMLEENLGRSSQISDRSSMASNRKSTVTPDIIASAVSQMPDVETYSVASEIADNAVPQVNVITCNVEVHREKSHTPASMIEQPAADGVDNPAYIASDSSHSLKQTQQTHQTHETHL
ncbi:cyclic nucleotide-gated channel beta-1-like [Tubulanus polymorphus]|uniref:cyclic nucleotide-gated channel beta-1-like n=1 Tax=Tubulanus polymorphus TaxID=672921 RepID=UPI003DA59244